MQLCINAVTSLLDNALKEDLGINGDITSEAIIKANKQVDFQINAREQMQLCGIIIAKYYFEKYSNIKFQKHHNDGEKIKKGDTIISGTGSAKELLMLERIILNFMQHMSGISTLTNNYVEKISHTKAKIYDTRKTLPTLRAIQKYAVRCGKGYNHRLTLDGSIMIKDNHIAICGNLKSAIHLAKQHLPHYVKIEVECDNLQQVEDALNEKVDIIMLDNMELQQIRQAVKLANGNAIIEASGGVSIDKVKNIAEAGVDVISVGKLTHSALATDIGLDIL